MLCHFFSVFLSCFLLILQNCFVFLHIDVTLHGLSYYKTCALGVCCCPVFVFEGSCVYACAAGVDCKPLFVLMDWVFSHWVFVHVFC